MNTRTTPGEFPSDEVRSSTTSTSTSGKLTKLLSVVALSTAALTACATEGKKADTSTSASSNTDIAVPSRTHKGGENDVKGDKESFEDWRKRENKESVTLKSHNRGNIVDLGVFDDDKKGLHTFKIRNGQEVETHRMKGAGKCDEMCFDMGNGDNKKAAHFEDPDCGTPNTTYGTVASDYGLKAAGVTEITYDDLNGEEQPAPMATTKHVLGKVEPGKSCTDLSRGVNTGTGTIKIAVAPDGPTRTEFNGLRDQVGEIKTQVDGIQETVNTHSTLIEQLNLCSNDPQNPVCVEARKAVRHNATDSAKGEKGNNPY